MSAERKRHEGVRQFIDEPIAGANARERGGTSIAGVVPPRASRERLEAALSRIADPAGEGARACLTVYADRARIAADEEPPGTRARSAGLPGVP